MVENLYHPGTTIRTISGKYIDVFNPDPEHIQIEDIAHALSNQCRFSGHMHQFYSVAQHSVSAAQGVASKYKMAALLHDASEAYLVDIPKPIKPYLTNYKEIEDRVMRVIAEKYGFEYPLPEQVKEVDSMLLEKEWNELVILKHPNTIVVEPPAKAKYNFLNYFEYLLNR